MRKNKAFTIMELLIVMAVIAILVGIAIPSFRAMQSEAKRTRADGDVRVIKLSLEAYYKNHDEYPAESGYQGLLRSEPQPLLESTLDDPFASAGTLYLYDLSTNGSYYVVYSIGPGADGVINITDTGSTEITGSPVYATNGW